jgi:hypothetical protein
LKIERFGELLDHADHGLSLVTRNYPSRYTAPQLTPVMVT